VVASFEVGEAALRAGDGVDDGLRVVAEGEAGGGEGDLLAGALEELDVEGFFEGLDLEGDGGLAHVESARGAAVVEKVGEGEEALQLPDPEVHLEFLGVAKTARRRGGAWPGCGIRNVKTGVRTERESLEKSVGCWAKFPP